MKSAVTTKRDWQLLLEAGAFSIGQFVVSARREHVRVYHMRTKDICYCSPEASFHEMQRLCRKRGYTLRFLLTRYSPKSFQLFTGSDDQGGFEKNKTENLSKVSGQEPLKTTDGMEEDPQDLANAPGEEIPGNQTVNQQSLQPSFEMNDRP